MRKSFNLDVLGPDTKRTFKLLASKPMTDFTLVGGTALALQIGHRRSNDLDFAVFAKALPTKKIDNLKMSLQNEGWQVNLITDTGKISTFKINTGENLLDYARDYTVNGVKVTFFAHGKSPEQKRFYQSASTVKRSDCKFRILGLDGLKVSKTLVLGDRVRSRDLFDLMVLMRDHGYAVSEALDSVRIGINNDPEYYKAVMTGKVPLDKDDEGLEAVGVNIGMHEIYTFFRRAFQQHEIELAADFFRDMRLTER